MRTVSATDQSFAAAVAIAAAALYRGIAPKQKVPIISYRREGN